jgi:hypothetical protein
MYVGSQAGILSKVMHNLFCVKYVVALQKLITCVMFFCKVHKISPERHKFVQSGRSPNLETKSFIHPYFPK